jgi:hypothetical protein
MSESTHSSGLDLGAEITLRRERRLKADASAYQRNNPIASDADPDSCLRRQVLEIVAWQDKPLIDDPWLLGLFAQGKKLEDQCKMWLLEDGFEVVHGQVPFELAHRKTGQKCMSGKQDFAIKWGDDVVTVEHKMVPQFAYDNINSVDDFAQHGWMKKYPAQMQSYLIGTGDPRGLFMVTDGRGQWKSFPVELDYDYAERIWRRAEEVVEWVSRAAATERSELPPVTTDQDQCEKCAFFGRTCNPEITNLGALALQSGELERLLAEREKVMAAGKEYNKMDTAVKKKLKAIQEDMGDNPRRLVVGAWTVEWGKRQYKQKTIEPEVRMAYHTWSPKIKWVGAHEVP